MVALQINTEPMGGKSELEALAKLVHEYGVWDIFLVIIAFSFLVSLPSIISWIKSRTRSKEEEKLFSLLSELTEQIRVLVQQYQKSISYEMAQVVLESLFKNASSDLNHFTRCIVEQNNIIMNRESIESRVFEEVTSQVERLKTRLALFDYKGHSLKDLINEGWKKDLPQIIIKILYNPNLDDIKKVRDIEEFINRGFDTFSYELLQVLKNYKTL